MATPELPSHLQEYVDVVTEHLSDPTLGRPLPPEDMSIFSVEVIDFDREQADSIRMGRCQGDLVVGIEKDKTMGLFSLDDNELRLVRYRWVTGLPLGELLDEHSRGSLFERDGKVRQSLAGLLAILEGNVENDT